MNPLLSFTLDWVRVTGGLWEEERPALYRVVPGRLPPGLGELSLLTDDPDVPAELVAPASRLFEAVTEDALARGRLAIAHLSGLRWTEAGVLRALGASFRVADARIEVEGIRPLEHRSGIFRYCATFDSGEVEKELVEVCVNLNNGRLARRVPDAAARLRKSEEPDEPLPKAPLRPAREAGEVAAGEARGKLAAARQARLAALETRCLAERSRAERYFDDLLREVEEDVASTRDAGRRAALEARRPAIAAERARALADIDVRHRLTVSLDLGSILVLAQPKVTMRAAFVHRKGWTGALPLVWDPLLEEFEAADCPACRRPGFEFDVTRSGIRCGRCATAAPSPPLPASS